MASFLKSVVVVGCCLLFTTPLSAQVFRVTNGRLGGSASAGAPPAATRCPFACAESNGSSQCDPDPCDGDAFSPPNGTDVSNNVSSGSAGTSGGLDDPLDSTTSASVTASYQRSTNGTLGPNGFSLSVTKEVRKGDAVGPRSAVPGACCVANVCSLQLVNDCASSGGFYYGDGVPCGANNTCPPRTGACCVGLVCSLQFRNDCNTAGGTFFGPGSVCAAQGACPPAFTYFANANTQGGFQVTIQAVPGIAAFTFTETGTLVIPNDPRLTPVGNGAGFVTVNGQTLLRPGDYQFDDFSVSASSNDPVGTSTATYGFELGVPDLGACCTNLGECVLTSAGGCGGAVFLGFGTACDAQACTGACCVSPVLCLSLTERGCLDRGGVFIGIGRACQSAPCAGACCSTSGVCTFISTASCPPGSTYGAPGPCQPLSCVGACCSAAGACTLVSATDCSQGGGAFRGIGVACAPFLCVGACCPPDGSCAIVSQSECTGFYRGLFAGYFTTCIGSPCTGACCLRGGECQFTNNGTCNNFGGIFRGLGVACGPESCTGGCCLATSCVVTSADTCRSRNGTFLGTDTTCAGTPCCCQPWDNGGPDGRGGQTSQLGVDADWRPLVNVAFDDFYLCDGNIYDIATFSGSMNTNAVLPKFLVVVVPDCNGRPDLMRPEAVAGLRGTRFHVEQEDVPFILGDIEANDSGAPDADGYRSIQVTARFDQKKLILKGGVHWVAFIGYSADLNPLDEFFWATSGNQVIKGKPGVFFDGDEFRDSDELCCGCTDYNFCVQGESCKILLDNGGPLALDSIGVPGTPSLQNGSNTQTRSRAADRFVLPPCLLARPCYVEAWLWTNCDRAGLQFFPGGCSCPPNGPIPASYLTSNCVMRTGITVPDGSGVVVELKKFQFFFNDPAVIDQMIGESRVTGFNVWISVFGLGDNRQNARAYFAYNDRCDRECDQSFGPGCIRPAPADQTLWRSNMSFPTATIIGHDYAFLVAVTEARLVPLPTATATCAGDANRDGTLTVQDLFDFLAAWFAGCP